VLHENHDINPLSGQPTSKEDLIRELFYGIWIRVLGSFPTLWGEPFRYRDENMGDLSAVSS
jgi:hypothetical protein